MSHGTPRLSQAPLPFYLVAVLALAPLAALLGGCGAQVSGGDSPQEGARQTEAPRIVAAEVQRREMVRYLETTTRIESELEITIHPEVAGIVTAVLAEEGDPVKAGEVLCELDAIDEDLSRQDAEVALQEAREAEQQPVLDHANATARVESTRLSWLQAQRDYERQQRLFENTDVASPVSRQTLEASRLTMETASAEHEQAKIALSTADLAAQKTTTSVSRAEVALAQADRALAQRTIRAPFDGQIATRSVRLGQSVGRVDAIFVLTDVAHLRAIFYRAQEELELFRGSGGADATHGSLVFEAHTEALPGVEFTGRVKRVSPTIDRDSGQFRVTGMFDPPGPGEPSLLPGMLVRLRIATDRHEDALVVPKRAVRREGDFTYVLKITPESTVERVLIREGYEDDDLVELVLNAPGTLDAGDRVVAVGSRDLEDGDPVRVDGDEKAAPEPTPGANDEATAGAKAGQEARTQSDGNGGEATGESAEG